MVPLRNLKRFFRKVLKQPLYAWGVGRKRIRANISYHLGGGKASPPEAITLFLTHRCNLRCKMCGQWGESGVTKKESRDFVREELSFDEIKNLIDDISSFKPNITLFGGEPLLYPDCVELIRYIKAKGMHCLMISNGALLDEYAERIVNAGLDEFNLSLDGARGLHDEIRGMPGLFENITRGLKKINRIKKEKKVKKPFINLQCTITKYNYKYLEQLLEVAKEIGADSLTYHNLIFLGRDLIDKQRKYDKLFGCSSRDWEGFVFEPEIDPEELYAKIHEILNRRYSFSVDFYPNLSLKGLRQYYNNPSYLPSEYSARCLSPWIVAYIFPDGRVQPCLNSTYSYGNIKKDTFTPLDSKHLRGFTEIWNSQEAIRFRKVLKKDKVFPVCARCTELYRY